MALLGQAGLLGIRPKLFTPLPERFEADDFYRCNMLQTSQNPEAGLSFKRISQKS